MAGKKRVTARILKPTDDQKPDTFFDLTFKAIFDNLLMYSLHLI